MPAERQQVNPVAKSVAHASVGSENATHMQSLMPPRPFSPIQNNLAMEQEGSEQTPQFEGQEHNLVQSNTFPPPNSETVPGTDSSPLPLTSINIGCDPNALHAIEGQESREQCEAPFNFAYDILEEQGAEISPIDSSSSENSYTLPPPEISKSVSITSSVNTESSVAYLDSLMENSPSGILKELSSCKKILPQVLEKDNEHFREPLNNMSLPTGLPTQSETVGEYKPQEPPVTMKLITGKTSTPAKFELEHKVPNNKQTVSIPKLPSESEEGQSNEFTKNLQDSLQQLETHDPKLNTRVGKRIRVEDSIDTTANKKNQVAGQNNIYHALDESRKNILGHPWEERLYPTTKEDPFSFELSPLPEVPNSEPLYVFDESKVCPIIQEGFDKNAKEPMHADMSGEVEKGKQAYDTLNQDIQIEYDENLTKVEEETEQVRTQQQAEQDNAKKQISEQKKEWLEENDKLLTEYNTEALAERKKTEQTVNQKVSETNQSVDDEINRAETQAEKEKEAAERDAQKEKEQSQEGSWWSRARNFLANAFKAIRDTINTIFDKARKLVKQIIEKVKQLVNQLIDTVCSAISFLIKVYGELLKRLVSRLLAKFPKIAEGFVKLIDGITNTWIDVLNRLAKGLKTVVNAILDVLAFAIDSYLRLYQALYVSLIDSLEARVKFWLDIAEGLYNLGAAASLFPSKFWGQVLSELLGQDVSEPLPNELLSADSIGNEQDTASLPQSGTSLGNAENPHEGIVPLMNVELSPEIMDAIANLKGKEQIIWESAEYDDESFMPQEELYAKEGMENGTPVADSVEGQGSSDTEQMVGPFRSPSERAKYLFQQMKTNVAKWFAENKVVILSGLVIAIGGGIALNIITAGAVGAALTLIMKVLSVCFLGETLVKIGKYLTNYLLFSWPGDIEKGGKSLARALAIGAIETVLSLLGVKKIKAVMKGAKRTFKHARNAARKGKNVLVKARNGAKTGMRTGGKLVSKSLRPGELKDIKDFQELGNFLGRRFRLKKVRIRPDKGEVRLEGNQKRWILLANGTSTQKALKELHGKGKGKVGETVKYVDEKTEKVYDAVIYGAHSKPEKIASKGMKPKAEKASQIHASSVVNRRREFERLWNASDNKMRKAYLANNKSLPLPKFMPSFGEGLGLTLNALPSFGPDYENEQERETPEETQLAPNVEQDTVGKQHPQGAVITPQSLRDQIGSIDYYQMRHNDFINRTLPDDF